MKHALLYVLHIGFAVWYHVRVPLQLVALALQHRHDPLSWLPFMVLVVVMPRMGLVGVRSMRSRVGTRDFSGL